jgi:RNA polymerase sigma factor (sigma-70 family)
MIDDDSELLLRYCRDRSEAAFTELVHRHLRMVYFAALRQVNGDAHLAQDVSQDVFTQMALKAPLLASRPSVAGWLYISARFVAARRTRGERQRMARHIRAQGVIEENANTSSSIDWERLAPVIDEALHGLNERDRELVLLRYFQESSFVQISSRMGLSSDAARFRLKRALEKMRASLARRGIESTSTALALALAGQAQAGVPFGAAATIARAALAAPMPVPSAFSLSHILMSASKLKIGVTAVTAMVIGTLVFQNLRQSITMRALRQQFSALQTEAKTLHEQVASFQSAGNRNVAGSPRQSNEARIEPSRSVTSNPVFQNLQAIQARGLLDGRYGALFKALSLTPEQLDQFKHLLIEKEQTARDALIATTQGGMGSDLIGQAVGNAIGPLDQQIHSLLGDSGYSEFQQFQHTLPERASVALLQQSLSYTSSPLSDDQTSQLIQLLAQSAPEGMRIDVADSGPLVSSQSAQITDQEITQAQAILSDQQVQALKQLQQQQQAQKQMQQILRQNATASAASHGG